MSPEADRRAQQAEAGDRKRRNAGRRDQPLLRQTALAEGGRHERLPIETEGVVLARSATQAAEKAVEEFRTKMPALIERRTPVTVYQVDIVREADETLPYDAWHIEVVYDTKKGLVGGRGVQLRPTVHEESLTSPRPVQLLHRCAPPGRGQRMAEPDGGVQKVQPREGAARTARVHHRHTIDDGDGQDAAGAIREAQRRPGKPGHTALRQRKASTSRSISSKRAWKRQSTGPRVAVPATDWQFTTNDARVKGRDAMSERTKLIARSCVFVAPEEIVTTVEIEHPATLGHRANERTSPDAIIVKGCPSRYALETCDSLQMGTLAYYRKKGDSLIWDLLEGVIAGDERVENRRNDPADLDAYKQTGTNISGGHPLRRALRPKAIKRLDVNQTSQSNLLLGDNCLIWCASIEPQTAEEWSLWQNSLESDYDHTTYIGKPAHFARALATMALSKRNLLRSRADLRNPVNGHIEQCGNLTVYFGPVAYLDDPRDYILAPDDALELIVRRIFTKTAGHRAQREYRFAILPEKSLERDTILLGVPYSVRDALNTGSGSNARLPRLPQIEAATHMPSPRLLKCFASAESERSRDYVHGSSLTTNIRQRVRLSGTHRESSTTRTVTVSEMATTDVEEREVAVRPEPKSSDDARIAKLTIDGGPGTVTHFYCREGIRGRIRYRSVSGRASLKISTPEPDGTIHIHVDNRDFDGLFTLSHSARQLILTVVPMTPTATVEIDQPCRAPELPDNHITLSPNDDTHVTVTATSEDGSQTSKLAIIIDQALWRVTESGTV